MEGWEEKVIGDVVQEMTTVDPGKAPDATFTYIDVSAVCRDTLTVASTAQLLGRDAPSRAKRAVAAGDVIFATIRPTLLRVACIPEDLDGAVCSTGFFVLRPRSGIVGRYLYYWLQGESFLSSMAALQRGASYPAVSDGDVRNHPIPVPPLGEQRRIVAILDEAFAAIETATAAAEKNLANARELFESVLRLAVNRCADSFDHKPLEAVASVLSGYAFRSTDYVDSGHFLIRIGNVQDGEVCLDNPKYVELDQRTERFELAPDDLVVSLTGNIGRVAKIGPSDCPAALNQRVARLRVIKPDVVSLSFLFLLLRAPFFFEHLSMTSHGVAQLNVSPKAISGMPLPLPPYDEQCCIVEQLQAIEEGTAELRQIASRKLALLGELKQSLLQKAFRGEL